MSELVAEQRAPVPERAGLPAVWDLVIADAAECRIPDDPGGPGPDPKCTYLNLLAMLKGYARHFGTDLDADMRERDATGRARYGTPLQPFNGRRALVDAYQELLDAAVYLRQHLYELEGR